MVLVRLTIRPWETVTVSDAEFVDLTRMGLIFVDWNTLYVNFFTYTGGPAVDVTGLTVTITESGDPVLGPTSDGVEQIGTGQYLYRWEPADQQGVGSYLVAWDGTDAQGAAVHAEETVAVTG